MKRHLLIYTILLVSFNNLFAQTTRTLKGNIKDKKTAESLIGASVMIKGTNTGTSTDFDGNFTLKTDKDLP